MHMAQLMPLPLIVSCFSKIQIGFTFLVPAHLGSPGQRAVKRVCECVSVLTQTAVFQALQRRECQTSLSPDEARLAATTGEYETSGDRKSPARLSHGRTQRTALRTQFLRKTHQILVTRLQQTNPPTPIVHTGRHSV